MYKNKKLAVLMPAYNADFKIESVINKIPTIYDKFIVVEDKSTDKTLEVLKKIKKRMPNMILIEHKANKGYGGAQKTLYKEALKHNFDYVVLLHDDGQYDPKETIKLFDAAIKNKADLVLGSRILSGKMKEGKVPFYKIFGNKFLTAIENASFGTKITEFHTGYRVYSRRALQSMKFGELTDKYYFDSQVILHLLEAKNKIIEIPISVNYQENITAANPFSYGLEIVYLILKYKLRRY